MPIAESSKEMFALIIRAVNNKEIGLLEVVDKKTYEVYDALCAMEIEGEITRATPLAVILRANPFDRLVPPEGSTKVDTTSTN